MANMSAVASKIGLNEAAALREVIRRSEVSGARRRAAVLHVDRLPPSLAKPHHVRLARQALQSLAGAERAQSFDLPRGRMAIVWRCAGGPEVGQAQAALDHLLSGQPDATAAGVGELLTLYDLPDEAPWLLDELAERPGTSARRLPNQRPMDLALLSRLEMSLAKADLSRFVRWRPVMSLQAGSATPFSLAWEERYFAIDELAASLCPEHDVRVDLWLFRRLTRTLDSRMLALLAGRRELLSCVPFSLNLNVATLLSPEFMRFDEDLPVASRGNITLMLGAADILSDPPAFAFARKFADARQYRLALADGSTSLKQFLDVAAAELDYIAVPLDDHLRSSLASLAPEIDAGVEVVLTDLDRPSDVRWAVENGYKFGRGRGFNP